MASANFEVAIAKDSKGWMVGRGYCGLMNLITSTILDLLEDLGIMV